MPDITLSKGKAKWALVGAEEKSPSETYLSELTRNLNARIYGEKPIDVSEIASQEVKKIETVQKKKGGKSN